MRMLRAIWNAIAVVAALLALRTKRRGRVVAEGDPAPRAELVVILLLVGVACFAAMFVVIYAADWKHQTQLLSLALGGSFAALAGALMIASKHLVVDEELEEEYPEVGEPDEEEKLIQIVSESDSRMTRKRFLKGAAGAAGAALTAALVVPAVSLGPVADTESLYYSPWYRGRRLVDEEGKPYRADDISNTTFYTAYPENVDHELLAAPVIVVRVDPAHLDPPSGRRAPTPVVPSRSTANRSSRRRHPGGRSCAHATTRPSTRHQEARSSTARPDATCRSCR